MAGSENTTAVPAGRHSHAITRRAFAAGAALVGAAALSSAGANAATADPVVSLYTEWLAATIKANAVDGAVVNMLQLERATGVRHPDHERIRAHEAECWKEEGRLLALIQTTAATTPSGALCKVQIARGYFLVEEDEYAFPVAALEDGERLLREMGAFLPSGIST